MSDSFLQSHEYVISTLFSILVLDGLLLASSLIIQRALTFGKFRNFPKVSYLLIGRFKTETAMNEISANQIQLFKSVFRGREDVFAIRWEKADKSGYVPAYYFDRYRYRTHKMKGGTFQNYTDKTYLRLTDDEIVKHLKGEQHIGIYPLLPDNTTWFLAADFDEDNWVNDSRKFLKVCNEKGIPAYMERSRSGKGRRVWIFLNNPTLQLGAGRFLFPFLNNRGHSQYLTRVQVLTVCFLNQDFLSGKGLGNLIALPLFKKTLEERNCCFINADTLQPITDQWRFLQTIKRISLLQLDKLYQEISNSLVQVVQKSGTGKLAICLNNQVRLSREGMTTALINFLKEELNFASSEFIIKKKIGKNTFGTERYFKFIEETENKVVVPRGFIGKLLRFCRENKIEYDFIDERKKQKGSPYLFNAQLREHQQVVVESISKKDLGVIVAPPGSGKTIVALKIISDKQQPALIIVHRKQLVEQWIERIGTFLGIPKHEIGKIGQGKNKVGNKITVATIQSLAKGIDKEESKIILSAFGTIIVDECHRIPAETFRNTITKLKTFYLYGLTATPFRKYNDGKLIFIHLGEVVAEIKANEISTSKQAKVIIRNTELDVPFNSKTDKFETLSKILVHDSVRNKLILGDVKAEINKGRKVVIITERKEHIDSLHQYLKQSYEAITLSGEDSEINKNTKGKNLKNGNYQVLITTGQFFGEGTDLQNAKCLFLVYPFSFEGKLIQYIGRVQRSEIAPTIYDYRDIKIDYLNKLFLKRNTYYRRIDKQATLFDEPTEEIVDSKKIITVEKEIKIPIEELEFRYGSVSFKHLIQETKAELEFEIENLEVRPEFGVLKPYFAKALKSNNIKVDIHAEFENSKLISQLATSADIEKINREVIQGIKFNFITKNFSGRNK